MQGILLFVVYYIQKLNKFSVHNLFFFLSIDLNLDTIFCDKLSLIKCKLFVTTEYSKHVGNTIEPNIFNLQHIFSSKT